MSDILNPEQFDKNLNDCYAAGYHDGAFPAETSYSDQFNAIRDAMLKHDAARRLAAPHVAPEIEAVLRTLAFSHDTFDNVKAHPGNKYVVREAATASNDYSNAVDTWIAAGRPGLK